MSVFTAQVKSFARLFTQSWPWQKLSSSIPIYVDWMVGVQFACWVVIVSIESVVGLPILSVSILINWLSDTLLVKQLIVVFLAALVLAALFSVSASVLLAVLLVALWVYEWVYTYISFRTVRTALVVGLVVGTIWWQQPFEVTTRLILYGCVSALLSILVVHGLPRLGSGIVRLRHAWR